MSTSTFGTVYDARPRSVVWNGSSLRQPRGSGLSMFTTVAHVSVIERPVLVPPWSVRPLPSRAFDREVDAVPVVGARRPEVRFERHVVLRAARAAAAAVCV